MRENDSLIVSHLLQYGPAPMRGRVEPLYTCVTRLVTAIYRLDGKAVPESLEHYTDSNDFKNQLLNDCQKHGILLLSEQTRKDEVK